MCRSLFYAFALTICAFIPSAAEAGTFLWGSNASGCVPADTAISKNLYFVTTGTVKHKPDAIGTITLYCPVTPKLFLSSGLNANMITFTYSVTGKATITVQLLGQSQSNASISDITGVLNGSSGSNKVSSKFSKSFIFDAENYYARIDLNRSVTTDEVTFYGVALDNN